MKALELWRQGVGSPLIIPPAQSTPERKKLDALAVVSWNTHVGGADLDRFIRDLRTGKLTRDEPIQDFVLLLQEVFRSGQDVPTSLQKNVAVGTYIRPVPPNREQVDIVERARRHSLALFYVPSMRNGKATDGAPEDRGNAILSTIALSSHTAMELPHERQRRVAIGAIVSGETMTGTPWTVRLVSVHLENRAKWTQVFRSFGKARLRQAKALVEAFSHNTPTVLGGDFNTWFRESKEPAIHYLDQFFHRSETPPHLGTVKHASLLPERKVDYLFFRVPKAWTTAYRRVDDRYGSDHYPLLGHITFLP